MPRRKVQDAAITIVVPVKDEEEAIIPFIIALDRAVAGCPARFSFLFIDDGSTDGTMSILRELRERDPRVGYLKLSRNFGKEAAMTAGLDTAKGDAVIVMDVDLQDPPELIPEFLLLWSAGFDTVYGARSSRSTDGFLKRNTAEWFYWLFNKTAETKIPPNAGDFRLMDRRVVNALVRMRETNRFMKGMFAWPGFSSTCVEYVRPERFAGSTKFNFRKLWRFAIDGIVSYSTVPLRIWTYIGALIALLSFMYLGKVVLAKIIWGTVVPGYSSLMTAILFFGGVQLISIGIMGEYLGRLYMETKRRPLYIIEEYSPDVGPANTTELLYADLVQM